jgi:tryptophan synthase beta chain
MNGKFGIFGGQYVSEQLMKPLKALESTFETLKSNDAFKKKYDNLLKDYVGRPTSLYYAKNLSDHFGGARIYLKREDLNHTGAHKINNALGQALIAKHMNKSHIICETGAGQHGLATATACALLDMKCTVFMGFHDVKKQASNVEKIKLIGGEIIIVNSGTGVLKDATNEAIRYWIEHNDDCHYIIGSVIGPHPYPSIVSYFQSIIGKETREQFLSKFRFLPDMIIACVGGGSNAIGMFKSFLEDDIELVGVEAGGLGLETPYHAASLTSGKPGILHGSLMYLLQEKGNIKEVHSISSGLDYPGVGPEHSQLKDSKRVRYEAITDCEAIASFKLLSCLEGIIPALESAHAIAQGSKEAKGLNKEQFIVICLSGRGEKDISTILNSEATYEKL